MGALDELITENIDIWTSAVKRKSSAGRGGGKKIELYGVKKLRELILDLAVRGLLVPQDPDDEPATVLLEQLEAQKQELVKAREIKKPKTLPPISDKEKPFEVPVGWSWTQLGNLIGVMDSGWSPACIPSASESNDVWGVLKTTAVQVMEYHENENKELPEKLEARPQYEVKPGDILITRAGPKNRVAISCLVESTRPKLMISDKIIRFHLVEVGISERFISLCLNAGITAAYLETSKSGMAESQMNISQNNLRQAPIAICPLAEQNRIVAKVDELMALCDQLEQQTESSLTAHKTLVQTLLGALTQAAATQSNDSQNATNAPTPFTQAWNRLAEHFDTVFTTEDSVEQLKQTILQLAVMGKLVPQDPNDEPASELLKRIAVEKEVLVKAKKIKKQKALPVISYEEKPFALPAGWEWSRLQDIGELARGKSKHRPRNAPVLYANGNIPLVQTGDVSQSNGVIKTYTALYNEAGLAQSRLWLKGTMCITIAANIADTGVLTFDACFPDSVVGFIPFDDEIQVRYFEYFIRTAKNDLEKYAPSTAQKNINLEILGNLIVPLPPLQELNQIVVKVEELMFLCDQLKKRLADAQATQLQLVDAVTEQPIT